MPLSWLKRPAVLAALLLVLSLCALKAAGFFQVPVPADWARRLWKDGLQLEGEVLSGFAPKRQGDRVFLLSESVRVMAYLPPEDPLTPAVLPGARAVLEGRLRRPRPASNPGDFDERAFVEGRGAAFVFQARRVLRVEAPPSRPKAWAGAFHRSVHEHLERRYPPETAGVLEGFLLGYKGKLSPASNRAVQDAGVMHLLVPSGAKVALVMGAVLWLAGWAGLARPLRFGLCALLGGFYTLAVGAEPPYTRAYLCAMVMLLALAFERESGGFQGLALAAILTLALEPRDLFGAGFQMTYAAALGIQLALTNRSLPRRWPRWARSILRACLASVVVQIMLWPTFAAYFGRGSLIGAAANLLLIPCSGAVMLAAFAGWASGADACVWAAARLSDLFLGACRLIAGLPWAAVDLRPMSALHLAAYYLAVFGLLALPRWRLSLAAWGLAAALGAAGLERRPPLEVLLLSQPGGRAALLRLPDKTTALLDGRIQPSLLRGVLKAEGLPRADELWLRGLSSAGRRPAALLAQVGGVRRLGPGELLRRGEAVLEAGPREPFLPLTLLFRRVSVTFGEDWVRAGGREGERAYCIMASPSGQPSSRCAGTRELFLRSDGAVRILSDGEDVHIEAIRDGDPFGRGIL